MKSTEIEGCVGLPSVVLRRVMIWRQIGIIARMCRAPWVYALVLVAGCGQHLDERPSRGPTPAAGADELPAAPGSVMRLIESPFEIRPFDEFYQCERFTAQEDLYITRIIPVAPPGTHHTILSVEPNATEPDGTSRCGAFDENWVMLFASGVGSPPLQMPPGVALKVPAGHQIVMNLHLSNATDGVVSGVSAYDIRTAAVSDVKQVAGILVAGRVVFTVPRKTIGFKVEGECSLEGGTRLFGVFPHAHQLGRHIKIWTVQGDAETVVHDAPYEFEEQLFSVFYPIDLKEGDQIRVECTYDNPSEFDVSFGDSSTDEMCFAVSYVTPPFDLGSFGQVCIF